MHSVDSVGRVLVRKGNFQIRFDLGLSDPEIAGELASAVRIVRPSRIHNTLILGIAYPVDGMVHQTIEYMCMNGVPSCRWDLVDPRSPTDPRGLQSFLYERGKVVDQYAPASLGDDADEPFLDFLEINFQKKHVTNRRWVGRSNAVNSRLRLVESSGLNECRRGKTGVEATDLRS